MEVSNKYSLSAVDFQRWGQNLLIFGIPVALMYLVFVSNNISTDGFQLKDFELTVQMQGALILYIINGFIDILKKYVGQTNYK